MESRSVDKSNDLLNAHSPSLDYVLGLGHRSVSLEEKTTNDTPICLPIVEAIELRDNSALQRHQLLLVEGGLFQNALVLANVESQLGDDCTSLAGRRLVGERGVVNCVRLTVWYAVDGEGSARALVGVGRIERIGVTLE